MSKKRCPECGKIMDEYYEKTLFICNNPNCINWGMAFRKRKDEE